MSVDDAAVKSFAALFAGRTDVNGRLSRAGKGYQDKAATTLAVYRAHLEGRKHPDSSLGIYPLRDDNTVWWTCGDLDLGDEASAWRVVEALGSLEVPAYVEVSKSKGHHVWVFFAEPTPAYAARRLMQRARREAGVAFGEIFPKQDEIGPEAPYGNFVHLPYYGHPEGAGRYMIGRDGRALTLDAFLGKAERATCPAWALEAPPRPSSPRWRAEHGVYRGERAACVQRLIDGPVAVGSRNEALVRLAAHLVNTEELVEAAGLVEDAAARWGLPASEARATLASVRRRGYQFGCVRKREVPEMAAACTWEACPFHRTPSRVEFRIEGDPPAALPDSVEPDIEDALIEMVAPFGFLRHYVDYCTTLSDAPRVAHLAAALALAAVVLGNRVYAPGFGGGVIRPNLWIVFVAPSGFRKSSVMSRAISFLLQMEDPADLLLSNKGSIEYWLEELARHPARLLHADEFMALYRALERTHMEEARSVLTELFATSRKVYGTKSGGLVVVENPALSILGGATPDELQQHLRREWFAAGFLARFIWLPARHESPAPKRIPKRNMDAEQAILDRLGWMRSLAGGFTFDDAIDARLAAWADEFRRRERGHAGEAIGLVNRAYDFCIKLAMVMQVSETEPGAGLWRDLDPQVVERAIVFTEWLIRNAIKFVVEDLADTEFERDVRRALDAVRQAGGEMWRWDLIRKMRRRIDEFDKIIDYARQAGTLREVPIPTKGRPRLLYRLPGHRETNVTDSEVLSQGENPHEHWENSANGTSVTQNGFSPANAHPPHDAVTEVTEGDLVVMARKTRVTKGGQKP